MEPLIARATQVLQAREDILFATVFGSVAHGRENADSDVDIAVAAKHTLSIEQRVDLANVLSEALGREVDLIDLQTATGTLLEQTLCTGKILFVKDRALYAFLLKKLWYDQADMKPIRDLILKRRRDEFLGNG